MDKTPADSKNRGNQFWAVVLFFYGSNRNPAKIIHDFIRDLTRIKQPFRFHGSAFLPPISLSQASALGELRREATGMGTVRRLAEEVERGLKTALPKLRETMVNEVALAVGAMMEVRAPNTAELANVLPLETSRCWRIDSIPRWNSVELFEWLHVRGWRCRLRLKGNLTVDPGLGEMTITGEPAAGYPERCLPAVRSFDHGVPTHLGMWHEAGHPELRIIAMDCAPNRAAKANNAVIDQNAVSGSSRSARRGRDGLCCFGPRLCRTPMLDLLPHEPGIYAYDTNFLRPGLAAVHLVVERGRVAVVDTASNACLPRALDALRRLGLSPASVDYVFLTHVHLDHAGGAGAMMRVFPEARLVVHPRGARHMTDPAELFAAAQAVYGVEEAGRLYGEPLPVPADRIIVAGDGHALDLDGRTLVCLDTPGHARHHLSLLDARSGGIFAGEAFGISLRELDVAGRPSIWPAIAPTQFDPAATRASVERILSLRPPALYLAHFGRIGDAPRLGGDLLRLLDAQVALAERERDAGPARGARLLAGLRAQADAEAARQGWRLATGPFHALLDGFLELDARALDGWLAQTAPRALR